MNPAPFTRFGPSHLTALAVLAGVFFLLRHLTRRRPESRAARPLERLFGTLLLLIWPTNVLIRWYDGSLTWGTALPLHYCDIPAISGGLALWTRHTAAFHLTYYWGMAGTLQGLITPSITQDFPSPVYFHFFTWHGLVIIAGLHGILNLRLTPPRGTWKRMLGGTLLYGFSVLAIDFLLPANYGFLREKPLTGSLMDSLGPWPWYLASLALVAALLYGVLEKIARRFSDSAGR
ncbi:MAG: TIGR02206 family membrane protein [Verrucomicrobiales bacterium]|nr:TIGR02206 family membrane protein [Verrucomicrobiales bacterium]